MDLDVDEIGCNCVEGVDVGIVGDTGLILVVFVVGYIGVSGRFDEWNVLIRDVEKK